MKIFESMEVAGSGLTAHRLWMDTISSNLANINTTRTLNGGPYKRRVPVFAEMLDKTIGGYEDIGGVRVIGIPPIPIGFDHDKGTVFLPYTKPCHGTSVVELPIDEEEVEKIRKLDTGNKK